LDARGSDRLQLTIGEYVEALIIAALLIFNVALGMVQEERANAALTALKSKLALKAFVKRDGQWIETPAAARPREDGGRRTFTRATERTAKGTPANSRVRFMSALLGVFLSRVPLCGFPVSCRSGYGSTMICPYIQGCGVQM